MRRLFVDVETTGLNPETDRIVEVAALDHDAEQSGAEDGGEHRFYSLVNPGREIDEEATNIHGHTQASLAGSPMFGEIADGLVEFLRGAEVVAHNASFDMAFLDSELARSGKPTATEVVAKVTDSLQVARRIYPSQNASLDALARRCGIDLEVRRSKHGAMIDAEILAEVYDFMHRGQTDMGLELAEAGAEEIANMARSAKIVPLAPDPAAAAAHREYLERMEDESGVPPLDGK